jgi:ferredoxin
LSPEVFEPDDDGYVDASGAVDVPDELSEAAERAVHNCPESAITFE